MDRERREELHAAQIRGLIPRREQLADREPVVAALLVRGLRTTGRDRVERDLAAQLRAAGTVGPPVLEHEVLPLLEDRWDRVPVERVLEHDDVVLEQQLLLEPDVDSQRRIFLVEVADRDAI